MFERYTEKARRVIFFARYEASQFGAAYIETEHLLLGLLREDRELIVKFLPRDCAESIRKLVEEHKPARDRVSTSVDMPLSAECRRVLTFASEEAERLAHKYIGPEHLFLGLLREKNGFAATLLARFGLEEGAVRVLIAGWNRGENPPWDSVRTEAASANRYASQLLGQGRLWRERYLHKSHGLDQMFFWERRLSRPRDALVKKGSASGQIMLYTGQPYDAGAFDRVEGGWKHDYCAVCYHPIYLDDQPDQSFGYTNGQEWLCERCYPMVMNPEP